jgi:hypothetical protein
MHPRAHSRDGIRGEDENKVKTKEKKTVLSKRVYLQRKLIILSHLE